MEKIVSRRSFVAGAGAVAAAAALVPAGRAAHAEEAAEGEVACAVSAWGEEYPWAAEPPAITADQIEEELDCDVCVIGLGVSGVAAFRAACEAGAKTLAFEKAETPSVRSMQYCYINGGLYDQLGMIPVDTDEIILGEWNASGQMASFPVIREFVRHEGEVFDWWVQGDDALIISGAQIDTSSDAGVVEGAPAEDAPAGDVPAAEGEGEAGGEADFMLMMNGDTTTLMGTVDNSVDYETESQASYPTRVGIFGHSHLVDCNLQKGIDAGGQAYFGHFGEQVIMQDGRAVGAYVRNAETGMYKKVNAAGGVVLSCGGCGSNKEMLKVFYPEMSENGNLVAWPNFDVEGNPTNTGDGYRMGYWAGAGFSQCMCAMTHVMGGPNDIASMDASSGLTSQHLRLNYNGKRFMNEDSSVSDCELAMDRQPKRKAFSIIDGHFDEQIANCVTEFSMSIAEIEAKVDNDVWFKGETLEELFDAIVAYDPDFQKDAALESVAHYNELCAGGYDADFLKQEKYLFPVQDGPFYAQRYGIGLCLTTMGGLCSDEFSHVLTTDHQVIPGLYVSGNIQGDRFAVKYPFKLAGASHAMAMYYGNVAGTNAAKGI